jgi:hypothetical protein
LDNLGDAERVAHLICWLCFGLQGRRFGIQRFILAERARKIKK